MSIEDDIMRGDIEDILTKIRNLDNDRIASLFLYSVIFEREDIACVLVENYGNIIDTKIISEAFESAAAHNEHKLIDKIVNLYPEIISKQNLLDAFRIAVVKLNADVIVALSKDSRFIDIVNVEDEDHPHAIMFAIDQGDYSFLVKLLQIPHIKIAFHHGAYATKRQQHKMSELLKLYMSKQYFLEDCVQAILKYEKDQCAIGPHLKAELAKRQRILKRERYK